MSGLMRATVGTGRTYSGYLAWLGLPWRWTMRVFKLFLAVAALTAGYSMPASAEMAKAALKDKSGKAVGDVDLSQTANGVLLKMSLKGMPPGERAFHIHAVGKCEAP